MLQLVSQLVPLLVAGIIAYMTYLLSTCINYNGSGIFMDLGWLLDKTPALDAFFMFIIQGVIVISTLIFSFKHISNHIVISLDILYFISILMLIYFHTIKDAAPLSDNN